MFCLFVCLFVFANPEILHLSQILMQRHAHSQELLWCHYPHSKRICLQCRRPRFDSWVRKILWRRKWQPTPVFLPGESHGQRSLTGLQSETWPEWLTHISFCHQSFPASRSFPVSLLFASSGQLYINLKTDKYCPPQKENSNKVAYNEPLSHRC